MIPDERLSVDYFLFSSFQQMIPDQQLSADDFLMSSLNT